MYAHCSCVDQLHHLLLMICNVHDCNVMVCGESLEHADLSDKVRLRLRHRQSLRGVKVRK